MKTRTTKGIFYGLCVVAVFAAMNATAAITTNVSFANFSFSPSSVTIHAGDTVVFSNAGGSHTVTGTGSDPICGSGTVATSCSHTFNTAGTFPYQCIPHAGLGMTGQVIVLASATPPSVSITNPANNAVFAIAPTNILIQASASGNGGASVTNVQFFRGTTLIGSSTGPAFSTTFSGATNGTYSLTAVAKDNNGNSSTSSVVSITVNAAPSVSITNPVNGGRFVAPFSGTLQAVASDSDGTISKVVFFANGNSIGTVFGAPYNFGLTNLVAGNYSLTAQATDNRGATTTSSAISISVITNAAVSAPQETTNGFQLTIGTVPNQTYIIEASTNLSNTNGWIPLVTNTPTGTSFNFVDSNAVTLSNRYYRVKSQ